MPKTLDRPQPEFDVLAELVEQGTESLAEYRRLVARIAQGARVDRAELMPILVSAGRSYPQLSTDVATCRARIEAHKAIDALADLDQQGDELRREKQRRMNTHDEIVKEAEKRIEEARKRVEAIDAQQRELNSRRTAQGNPHHLLRSTAEPEAGAAKNRQARSVWVGNRLSQLREWLQRLRTDESKFAIACEQLSRARNKQPPYNSADPEYVHLPKALHSAALAGMGAEEFDQRAAENKARLTQARQSIAAMEAEQQQLTAEQQTLNAQQAEADAQALAIENFALCGTDGAPPAVLRGRN